MSSENLNQADFQGRYFTMHVNSCQIELNLKPYIYISSIYSRGPPKSESSVWYLI